MRQPLAKCLRSTFVYAIFLCAALLFVYVFFQFAPIPDKYVSAWPAKIADAYFELKRGYYNNAPEPKFHWHFPNDNDMPTKKNVTVLMWTTYYGNTDLVDHVRRDSPIPDWCDVTFDKNALSRSDAIVFYMIDSDFRGKDLPRRNISQPWIFFIIEPPAYHSLGYSNINGIFNRTMTFRLDSDYPCPYGYLTKRPQPLTANPYYEDATFPRNKTKLLAWMVSHCSTVGKRETYVAKIQKLTPVDVYGSCGTLPCDKRKELGCYEKLGATYKFYLSLENSLCKDYVTEKFSNALHANMVPVVYGCADYRDILPHYPKPAYINIFDYPSPEALVAYLKYLDSNETAYAEYFEWSRFYKVHVRQGFAGFKKICYDMRIDEQPRWKVYDHMNEWWSSGGRCQLDKLWPRLKN